MSQCDVTVTFKLSADDKELLSILAEKDARTMSSEIRKLIKAEAERLGVSLPTK